MSRPLWVSKMMKAGFAQAWMIAEMTKWPVVGGWIDDWLFGGDDLFIVPKPKVIPINQSIPGQEQTCLPSQVVDHFISQANFLWLMHECICRAGMKCKDYPIELGCLFLGEAARQINPKMGRQVSREEALAHAKKCREAGLVHLIGRNKLDVVWLKAGPGEKLLTICNCCPCCCIWNNLPHLSKDITQKIHKMPGVLVAVNDNCNGCGKCVEKTCFAGAIKIMDGKAVISELCRGCGRCAMACDQEAITISISNQQILNDSIQRITQAVDVK